MYNVFFIVGLTSHYNNQQNRKFLCLWGRTVTFSTVQNVYKNLLLSMNVNSELSRKIFIFSQYFGTSVNVCSISKRIRKKSNTFHTTTGLPIFSNPTAVPPVSVITIIFAFIHSWRRSCGIIGCLRRGEGLSFYLSSVAVVGTSKNVNRNDYLLKETYSFVRFVVVFLLLVIYNFSFDHLWEWELFHKILLTYFTI